MQEKSFSNKRTMPQESDDPRLDGSTVGHVPGQGGPKKNGDVSEPGGYRQGSIPAVVPIKRRKISTSKFDTATSSNQQSTTSSNEMGYRQVSIPAVVPIKPVPTDVQGSVNSASSRSTRQASDHEKIHNACLKFEQEIESSRFDDVNHSRHQQFNEEFLKEKNANVFSKFYPSFETPRSHGKTPTGMELSKYTHKDALNFAAASNLWYADPPFTKPLPAVKFDGLSMYTVQQQKGIRAYYRVVDYRPQEKYILECCHVNSQGLHRPDLRFLEVNDKTVTNGFGGNVLSHLFLGDIIVVSALMKSEVQPSSTTIDQVLPQHCRFTVRAMSIQDRTIETPHIFMHVSNARIISIGRPESVICFTQPKYRQLNVVRKGWLFVPEKNRVFYSNSCMKQYQDDVRKVAFQYPRHNIQSGTIFKEVNADYLTEYLKMNPEEMEQLEEKELVKLLRLRILLGDAAIANTNYNKIDNNIFDVQSPKMEDSVLTFSIDMRFGNEWTAWQRNMEVVFKNNCETVEGVIESVQQVKSGLKSPNSKLLTITTTLKTDLSLEEPLIVHQKGNWNSSLKLETDFYSKLKKNSNGMLNLRSLFTGSKIMDKTLPIPMPQFQFPSDAPYWLNEFQNEYVCKVLAGNSIVCLNSPFGSGQSDTIVVAAIEALERWNREKHFLVTQTNAATVNLMSIASKVQNKIRFLRLVSPENYKTLPNSHKSPFDYPSLMENVFRSYIQHPTGALDKQEKQCVEAFFQEELDLSQRRSLFAIFMKLYQPEIVAATVDTLRNYAKYFVGVKTIQIDEGTRMTNVSLAYLFSTFQDASFGLVGDVKQSPPFTPGNLPEALKDFAIGAAMKRAVENCLVPTSFLKKV
ncbi:unnamed protein product [Caenorhabditis nigoni]